MKDVERRLAEYNWPYAQHDPDARMELTRRIEAAARQGKLLTYSDLIKGVSFCIPNVNAGRSFGMDLHDLSELDRAIIGDFLGCISAGTYRSAGVFVSAIVVTKHDGTPGMGFTKFMRDLGLIPSTSADAAIERWVREVQNVHSLYQKKRINRHRSRRC